MGGGPSKPGASDEQSRDDECRRIVQRSWSALTDGGSASASTELAGTRQASSADNPSPLLTPNVRHTVEAGGGDCGITPTGWRAARCRSDDRDDPALVCGAISEDRTDLGGQLARGDPVSCAREQRAPTTVGGRFSPAAGGGGEVLNGERKIPLGGCCARDLSPTRKVADQQLGGGGAADDEAHLFRVPAARCCCLLAPRQPIREQQQQQQASERKLSASDRCPLARPPRIGAAARSPDNKSGRRDSQAREFPRAKRGGFISSNSDNLDSLACANVATSEPRRGAHGRFVAREQRGRWPNSSGGSKTRSSLVACRHQTDIRESSCASSSTADAEKPLTLSDKQAKAGENPLIESASASPEAKPEAGALVEARAEAEAATATEKLAASKAKAKPAAAARESGSSELARVGSSTAASCKVERLGQCQRRQSARSQPVDDNDASPSAGQEDTNNNNNSNIESGTNKDKGTNFSDPKSSSSPSSAAHLAQESAAKREASSASGELGASNKSSEERDFSKCNSTPNSCATSSQQATRTKATNNHSSGGEEFSYIDWDQITRRYRKMPRQSKRDKLCWQLQSSCLCRLFVVSFQTLFPFFTSFNGYRLPGDLVTDLLAGSTVAVLHIPQGMAYGLLAGVDPIYGLYVSFVPVIVMALMSRSRHVSCGTFAILSMMLASACELAKTTLSKQHSQQQLLQQQQQLAQAAPSHPSDETPLVLVNNHRMMLASEPASNGQLSSGPSSLPTGRDEAPQQHPDASVAATAAATAGNWLVSSLLSASPGGLVGETLAPDLDVDGLSPTLASAGQLEMPTNIEILTCICILVGLIQITMSLLRLGILSLMFSDQLVSSFTAASAFHVMTSQVPSLFDLDTPHTPAGLFKVCRAWWSLTLKLHEGFNHYTALLSLASIIFLLIIKELVEPMIRRRLFKSLTCLPSELFLMACVIFSSWYWKFEHDFNIDVIGHVPTELPAPKPPRLDLIPIVFQDALTVALVSFAMNLSLGQVYAKRNRYQLDPNQELFALGTSNVVGSFFSCFPCASSLSRSAVQSSLNVKSQLCSLFSSGIVVLIICYFAPILHDLPRSTLSCIIVVALKGILFQVKDFYENWRLSKLDAIVWITTFISVLAFGVTYGLVLGIAASLFMVFVRLLNPNHSILGQLPETEIYVDKNAFMDCQEIEQVKIFRFNSALCYLNRTMFKACIERSLPMIYKPKSFASFYSRNDSKSNDNEKIKFLIIDCSALAYCDYSGAETLVDIVEELEEFKVQVYLAACPAKLINMIEKMRRTKVLQQNLHPTITDALIHAKYLKSQQMQQCSKTSCNTDARSSLHSVINVLP